MKTWKFWNLLTCALLVSLSCSGNGGRGASPTATAATAADSVKEGKALIVFFSHAGDNYAVGNIKQGNTKLVADEIRQVTGADIFEIVAEKSYDMPYRRLTEVARAESEQNELPAFKGSPGDLSRYSTLFVGGPIWWGTYPRVMFTFFHQFDLNGKTLIPFTTHEGSGLGRVVEDLQELYPHANVKGAFSIAGHKVRSNMAAVDEWLQELGY